MTLIVLSATFDVPDISTRWRETVVRLWPHPARFDWPLETISDSELEFISEAQFIVELVRANRAMQVRRVR